MTTGQLIRAARKNAGMTQAELAQKLGISYVGISQWENDLRNPKFETLQRIAHALGVSFDVLFPKDDKESQIEYLRRPAKEFPPPPDARARAAMMLMNDAGQAKVADYAEDILPKYQCKAAPASLEGKGTTPGPEGSDPPDSGEE